ncbi:hypothetical protein STRAU_5112 [Streptomyces aurantiacus JA 4570]|uniref:Uncharacterized protein n=1 Tax=Streptomyces aurantiacus JA 4570 TaxID=1286094 RepID=S3ZTU0_9ACTN|nr:hypothetical protein STRAU_5112 [Streptomyces aurantiacus JA 4570]
MTQSGLLLTTASASGRSSVVQEANTGAVMQH